MARTLLGAPAVIPGLSDMGTAGALVWLVAGGAVIAFSGPRLADCAATLARRHGVGQAIAGSVLLGASTSLSGLVVSLSTAWQGQGGLAVANAVGGIAAQTAFLAIADFAHRGVNLEHAAVDPGNLLMSTLLIALLGGVLLAMVGPDVSFAGVHPMSWLLVLGYVGGLRIAADTDEDRSWIAARSRHPIETDAAQDGRDPRSTRRLWGLFGISAAATLASGWLIGRAAMHLTARAGLDDSVVGGLFTAIATSSAELVTAVAAVRAGALALAVGDIVGGNVFDVLFIAASDVAYREGSVYHAVSPRETFLVSLCIVLTATLAMGLVRREPRGPANVGFETVLVLVLYASGFLVTTFAF